MQAVVIHEVGGPDVLCHEEAERPEPGDDEVLIRVRAASLNPVDWKYRRGYVTRELPAILGNDLSGTVERSGSGGFAEGEQVCGIAASGGYAELATAGACACACAELVVMTPQSEQLARIVDLIAGGNVGVEIAAVLPLREARQAHALSESGHTRGKIVLTIGT